ncbi:MAG TPA: hypothetical protein VNM66_03630 [Thermodesulfobacteriota bacterium]|nr:hypothetical protein [Thermodesulfobacteriota bacterium]
MSRRRLSGRRYAPLLALLGLVAAAPAAAQPATVQVDVIYATNVESGVDPGLERLVQSLGSFRYSAYRRLGGQTLQITDAGLASVALPGGRQLQVVPRRLSSAAADLRVSVFEGGRKVVASDVRLVRGGQPVLVGGFKHQQGVLFLAIKAMR